MEWLAGEFVIRSTDLPTIGAKTEGHKHQFGHLTVVVQGVVRVLVETPDGVRSEVILGGKGTAKKQKRRDIWVRAEDKHSITALTRDAEYFCIYAHRNKDGSISPEYKGGMMGAYG